LLSVYFFLSEGIRAKNGHIKSRADALISSPHLMIVINVIAAEPAPYIGLICAMASILIRTALIWLLPVPDKYAESF